MSSCDIQEELGHELLLGIGCRHAPAILMELPAHIKSSHSGLLPPPFRPRDDLPRQVFADHSKSAIVIVDLKFHAWRQMFGTPCPNAARL